MESCTKCHQVYLPAALPGRREKMTFANGLIAISLFLTIAGMLTYVFVGLQKYRVEDDELAAAKRQGSG